MIYVILGMHKSGTTLLAQMLHKSGINMGNFDESGDYDSGNKYERKETVKINKALLSCGNDFSLKVTRPLKGDIFPENYHWKMMYLIGNLSSRCKNWGFKDPRTCLTFGAWHKHLPEHQIIFVYRCPLEVWTHYQRKISAIRLIRKLDVGWKAITAWYVYNSEALKYVEQRKDKCFITEYRELMRSQNELKRLESFLHFRLVDCRKEEFYRSRYTKTRFYDLITWLQARFFSRSVDQLYNKMKRLGS